tara:strand:- start:413 stop:598 length:186 start_codon:yes stop_codon:yes gene_type:complete
MATLTTLTKVSLGADLAALVTPQPITVVEVLILAEGITPTQVVAVGSEQWVVQAPRTQALQ